MKHCDKCGKQVKEPRDFKQDYPRFDVYVDVDFYKSRKNVDLCHDCEILLDKWIKTPPEPAKEETPKAEPVVGEWIFKEWRGANSFYQCSLCGADDEHHPSVEVPFCWHCGSPMKVKPKGEENA